MASIGSSVLPASALLTTPKIVNIALALANTEYPISIPTGTRKFSFQLREAGLMKVADTAGDIASNLYFSISPGNSYEAESITGSSTIDLYVQVSKPLQVLEVWYWL